jgi:uncharacterized damage-inducible protein DinB
MVTQNDRSLGRIAWHIVTSTPGMLSEYGLTIEFVENQNETPSSAKVISENWRKVSVNAVEAVKQQWTDEALQEIKNVFGMSVPKAGLLSLLIKHIIHHRGQLTVLMRQAGLKVPGVYGPAREEWSQMGMDAPLV